MLSKNDSFFEKIFSSPPWTRCFQTPSLPCFLLISFRAIPCIFSHIFHSRNHSLQWRIQPKACSPVRSTYFCFYWKGICVTPKLFVWWFLIKERNHSFFAFRLYSPLSTISEKRDTMRSSLFFICQDTKWN